MFSLDFSFICISLMPLISVPLLPLSNPSVQLFAQKLKYTEISGSMGEALTELSLL